MSERHPENTEIIPPGFCTPLKNRPEREKPKSGAEKSARPTRRGAETKKKAQPNSATRLGAEGKSVQNRASRNGPSSPSWRIAIIIENSSTTQGGSSPASCGSAFERGARKANRSNRQAEMPPRHGSDQHRKKKNGRFAGTPQPRKTAPSRRPCKRIRSAPTSSGAKKSVFPFGKNAWRSSIVGNRESRKTRV